MKNIIFFITTALISTIAFAKHTNYNRYEKPFIFVENGTEFAVFNDGQFDFNIINSRNVNFNINTRDINFSFNTGHNYNAFVQYDNYGAVVQVENTPIYYDNFGRVSRIGATKMYYNNFGYANRIGNLYISYNSYGIYNGHRGAINGYQCNFSPRHNYYRLPPRNRCVVYNSPYRRNYSAKRYNYNNYSRRYAERPRYYSQRSKRVVHYNTDRKYGYTTHRNKPISQKAKVYQRNYSPRKAVKNETKKYTNGIRYSTNNRQVKKAYTDRRAYASTTSNNRNYRRR